MKGYVILVHKNAEQVKRLIQSLEDGASTFFIHIDLKVDAKPFESLKQLGTQVIFLPRVKTGWGTFGPVKAILIGLRAVRDSVPPIQVMILLSGQDYPIKSNKYISEFFEENRNSIFIEYSFLPNHTKWRPNGGMFRVNKYFFGLKTYQRYSAKAVNFTATYFRSIRRKLYKNMTPYAGSMWWIANKKAIDHILRFVEEHPGYSSFHKYTFAADEVFFHTILLNASKSAIAAVIKNDDKRFIKWKNIEASHPEMIGREYLDELTTSNALFARKFDLQKDPEIFDLIDKYCRIEKQERKEVSENRLSESNLKS